MNNQPSTSLGAQYYTQLMEQISLEAEKQHQKIKDLSSREALLRSDLEKETEKAKSLYEIMLFSENMVPYLKQFFEGLSIENLHKSLKKQIITLVEDLKTSWEKEIKQDIEKKADLLLQEIGEKEEAIKKAIKERQEEIEEFALKVIKKAEDAQKGIK